MAAGKSIYQLGTFDVGNYGDLLFPHIASRRLRAANLSVQPVSPMGGRPVEFPDAVSSIGTLEMLTDTDPIAGVIIGGGNIIHCAPSTLSAYMSAGRGSFAYADLWLTPSIAIPDRVPIVWNAPGVPARFDKSQHGLVRDALQRTSYLSVRDEISRNYLLEVWPDADITVVPDTAWEISNLWAKENLRAAYENILQKTTSAVERTVVYHLNKRYLRGQSLEDVCKSLVSISQYLSAYPIIVPFGPCHQDDALAIELSKSLNVPHLILNGRPSLRDITACIAFSCSYVGSSMHGLICASAFEVPGLCVANKEMAKFMGLLSLINEDRIVVSSWNEACSSIRGNGLERRMAKLRSVSGYVGKLLDSHWKRVTRDLSLEPGGQTSSHDERMVPNVLQMHNRLESPRVLRRLQLLRKWSHEQEQQIFA